MSMAYHTVRISITTKDCRAELEFVSTYLTINTLKWVINGSRYLASGLLGENPTRVSCQLDKTKTLPTLRGGFFRKYGLQTLMSVLGITADLRFM